ncbi:hypothetical protein [Streptomyces sp. AP-93]|uniref:hypothetical protein n=1 Tax=Streptomyces sp. AP-93 TaxID=2929048 RepID=UPI001FB04593|nr:hypothetical protein [Streptomyces sp. AP-93]MCJ0872625.1 hypothetical protein [Streptomyces sp. AP-93]
MISLREKLHLAHVPVAYGCMIVRRPADETFRPCCYLPVLVRQSSGPMVVGVKLRWECETYGASTEVRVREVAEGRLIRFVWATMSS